MSGTSVTGKGPGESLGEYKPQNQSCCCGGSGNVETPSVSPILKRGCVIKQKNCQLIISKNGRKNSWYGC